MIDPVMRGLSEKPGSGEIVLGVMKLTGLPILMYWDDEEHGWVSDEEDNRWLGNEASTVLRGWYSLSIFKEVMRRGCP